MLDIDNMIDMLREAIEEKEWDLVGVVLEILTEELDNPINFSNVSSNVINLFANSLLLTLVVLVSGK